MIRRCSILGLMAAGALLLALFLVGCGSSGSTTTRTVSPATVSVTMSDPPTCSATYSLISITVVDVKIHASATAGLNDPGWIDLTPNMTTPKSIDLVSNGAPTTGASQCFLATLGAPTNLAPGTYQQVQVILATSGTNPSCPDAGPNCVKLQGGTAQPLLLSSEAQTGIKIPSGQIAGGQFTVSAGQSKTLNINFDACASIVPLGNGQFRLKPVLHAGEVNTTSNAVDGTLIDSTNPTAAFTGPAVVVLEQDDGSGTGTFRSSGFEFKPDASGFFSFCPVPTLPTGSYALVVAAANSSTGGAFAPAIITGVTSGSSLGKIPLVPSAAPGTPSSINGLVTTTTNSAPVGEDVTLSAMQKVGSTTYTIPLPLQTVPGVTANVNTVAGTCPANTDCVSYTLEVPGVTPTVIGFTAGTAINFTGGGNTAPTNYTIEAAANKCTPSTATTAAFAVSPGVSLTPTSTPVSVPQLNLTGCQ